MKLDHERLDVYQVSLDFSAWAYDLSKRLKGRDRHARDQVLRASHSIAFNIAEGCGKIPTADRSRFLQIASGSARECGAILDILNRCRILESEQHLEGKEMLFRIVSMLTRLIGPRYDVHEDTIEYGYETENEGENENVNEKEAVGQKINRRL